MRRPRPAPPAAAAATLLLVTVLTALTGCTGSDGPADAASTPSSGTGTATAEPGDAAGPDAADEGGGPGPTSSDDAGAEAAPSGSPAEAAPDAAPDPAPDAAPDPVSAGGISAPLGREASAEAFLAAWRAGDAATVEGMAAPGVAPAEVEGYTPRAEASTDDCSEDGTGAFACWWDVEEGDSWGVVVSFTQADDGTWDAGGGPAGWG